MFHGLEYSGNRDVKVESLETHRRLGDPESDWRPTATVEALRLRAQILERLRRFFADRNVLEVETPVLSSGATTDPRLASFRTLYVGPGAAGGRRLYLQTSPEFAMKRLLAAGSGSIYQICRAFRDGESGRLHNPEFTLLEWYRVEFDYHALMDEAAGLVASVLADYRRLAPAERMTYREAFVRYAGIDPHAAEPGALVACARRHGLETPPGLSADDIDGWRDLLLTHVIEPNLGMGRVTLVYDYPASAAALARIRLGDPPLAERFELYLDGIELANGFHELTDADEQRRRFRKERAIREATGLPVIPMDERLLAALAQGLPECAGAALGIDRLVMIAAGAGSLAEVTAFPIERA